MARRTLKRILLVEDDPDIQTVTSMALGSFGGYTVRVCGSAAEAMESAAEFLPDLILLDVMMPGMDGMQVLSRVRAEPRTASVPVVMFSAVADKAFIDDAIRRGANDYWVKASFNFTELKDRLDKLLPAG